MFDPAFSDAPIAASQAVLEFADVSRNSRQSQFFVSMIQATFEKRPIRHRAFDCEVREVWSDADFSTAVSRIKQTRISPALREGDSR